MSAFLVSKKHVDAIVSMAIFGVTTKNALSGTWFALINALDGYDAAPWGID